jgi:hypothetical protein
MRLGERLERDQIEDGLDVSTKEVGRQVAGGGEVDVALLPGLACRRQVPEDTGCAKRPRLDVRGEVAERRPGARVQKELRRGRQPREALDELMDVPSAPGCSDRLICLRARDLACVDAHDHLRP